MAILGIYVKFLGSIDLLSTLLATNISRQKALLKMIVSLFLFVGYVSVLDGK